LLVANILFLEGTPIVSSLREIHIGPDVVGQLEHDRSAEEEAIQAYNQAVRLSRDLGDNGTRELLASILQDEEEHIDEIEAQLDQISQVGIAPYLAEQIVPGD